VSNFSLDECGSGKSFAPRRGSYANPANATARVGAAPRREQWRPHKYRASLNTFAPRRGSYVNPANATARVGAAPRREQWRLSRNPELNPKASPRGRAPTPIQQTPLPV